MAEEKPKEAEVKKEAKPEAKPEIKPEVKPEAKPEAKPEVKMEKAPEKKEVKPPVKAPAKPLIKAPVKAKPVEKKVKLERKPKAKDLGVELKIFNKWSMEGLQVTDLGIASQITLQSKIVPHTFGQKSRRRFEKREMGLVERLVNKVMRSGQGKRKLSGKYIRGRGSCGKKIQALHTVEKAFEIIERETKENPIQILVRAVENAAPCEDITRLKKGGISYTQAVDIAPLRRVDESLKNIAVAAFSQSFNSKTPAAQALAKEIMLAAKKDAASFSVKRRNEVERIAASSR